MQAMRNLKYVAGAALVSGILTSVAFGQQGWAGECLDPMNMMPYSPDYASADVATPLMQVHMGISGTVTYGGTAGPCYAPTARTLNAEGRLGFSIGAVGSIQTNFDNNLALTMGAPADPVGDYCYARFTVDDEDGAHAVHAACFQALSDCGFSIPGNGGLYWVGEAMQSRNYVDLDDIPEPVAQSITLAASNTAHLARRLKARPYPGVVAQEGKI